MKQIIVSQLILVSIVSLSNDDYSRKREILLTSHLELNKYFTAVTEWNEQAIRQRGEILADKALKVWSYFGSEQPEPALPLQGVRGTTPKSVTILGQTFSVSTWREVLQITLETIAELDYERFDNLLAQFPRFVGRDPARFRACRQLPNGAYMETNLSAESIHRFCLQAAEVSGLSGKIGEWNMQQQEATDELASCGERIKCRESFLLGKEGISPIRYMTELFPLVYPTYYLGLDA